LTAALFESIVGLFKKGQIRKKFSNRWIYAVGTTTVYAVFVYWLYTTIGEAAFAAVVIPVLLVGWWFGAWGGVIYSLLALIFNILLATGMNAGPNPLAGMISSGIYTLLIVLLSLAAGWAGDLYRRWRREQLGRRLLDFNPSESEQISHTVLEHSPVGITVRNRNGELLFYNPAWMRIWGLDIDQVTDQEARSQQLAFEQRYPYLSSYTEAVNTIFEKGGELFVPEVPAQRQDNGEKIWISQYLYALKDEQGQVDKVVVMTQDVTQRFKTQEVLKDSEKRYRDIFDHANDINLILYQGLVVDCNQRTLDLFGLLRDEIVGHPPSDFSPLFQPDGCRSVEKSNEKIAAALAGEPQRFEWQHRRLDGETFMAEVSLNRLDFPSGPHIFAALRDITERKRSEQVQRAIYRISEAANSSIGLQELFATIHAILNELMEAENLFIALYDAEKDLITFPYFVDQYDLAPEARKPSKGLTEFVLHTQQAQLITPERFDLLVEKGEVTNYGTPSVDWLGVPLKVEGEIIGVMGTQTYKTGVRFGKEERDIVSFVSDQIAMAVHRKRGEERLKYLSIHDPLTGLYNRAYFEEELARLERGRKFPVSVLVADLDGLKKINDQYGHEAGDQALCQAARLLQGAFRAEDGLARIGGDEFAVLLPEVNQADALEVVERVRCLLEEHNQIRTGPGFNISIGIATYDNATHSTSRSGQVKDTRVPLSINEAMHLADERMYQDKKRHKREEAKEG
jgi:diguanylate cyclase (GGDEF)-like protein/PAS domain S-box-containing protein